MLLDHKKLFQTGKLDVFYLLVMLLLSFIMPCGFIYCGCGYFYILLFVNFE